MKSLLAPILLTMSLNSNFIAPNFDSVVYYVNSNNVEMTEVNYNKLIQLGYVAREIELLSQEEYDEMSSLHIKQTVAYSYVEKSTYNVTNNNISLISKNIISKEEAIKEITLSKNATINTRSTTNVTSQVQDEYKQITLTGSITGLSQDEMKYFVKATNMWLTPPVYRGFDYISLNMDDNVQICMQTINGLQRPFFSSSFIYTRTERYVQDNGIFDPIESITTTEVIEEIANTDTDDYKYVIGEGISTGYKLPTDAIENNSSIGNYSEFSITHTNLLMSISGYFEPQIDNLIRTTFGGAYSHSTLELVAHWPSLSLTNSPPYIIIETGVGINATYDVYGTFISLDSSGVIWPNC